MNAQAPSVAFADLLAYTDYLAQRWLNYFKQHPKALAIDVGGRTGTLRDLVTHLFQVEQFFANLLLQEGSGSMAPPAKVEAPGLEELGRMHHATHQKLVQYIDSANDERLQHTRRLCSVLVSERKILTQAVLHSVHHWAQVAMEVRQAGFPTEKPQDIIASAVMT